MTLPLMPKATAVWLVENTALTFEQIADFCGMHSLEVQGIADGEVAAGIIGQDPVLLGQVTREEIERCEKDEKARLSLSGNAMQYVSKKVKGARYTPVARRQDKPDSKIVKLIGTTKSTIAAVRGKTHWNSSNIKPRDPVLLGLCSQMHLDAAIAAYKPAEPEGDDSNGEIQSA